MSRIKDEVAKGRSFGVAVKAAIMDGPRVLVLYKTAAEALGDPDPAIRVDLPGGRVAFGESPVEALHREVGEETALSVEVIAPIATWHHVHGRFQLVGIDFLCEYVSGEVALSDEHERFAWLTEGEMAERHPERKTEFAAAYACVRSTGHGGRGPGAVEAAR
jgi:8-oxo-dGTP diphosphatase